MEPAPTLKTRRSNAVHSRRLALHIATLERHLAALEADRARAVRMLQEELNVLHMADRKPPSLPSSQPHLEESLHEKICGEKWRSLPTLEEGIGNTDPKWLSVTCERFPPATALLDSDSASDATKRLLKDIIKQSDPSIRLGNCSAPSCVEARKTRTSRNGQFYLREPGSNNTNAPDPCPPAVPFRVSISARTSKSQPPASPESTLNPGQRFIQTQPYRSPREEGEKMLRGQCTGLQSGQRSEAVSIKMVKPILKATSSETTEEQQQARGAGTVHALRTGSCNTSVIRRVEKRCHLAGAERDRCDHFPCTQPPTYHSLGFHPDHSTHPWGRWLLQNTGRPHHRLVPGHFLPPPPTSLHGRRRGRRTGLGSEETVVVVARKRHAHHARLARPPAWNVNYGQPTPRRRVKCQVRMDPCLSLSRFCS
ncbi:uncharacterized protein LOC143281549 [Babylonia areolata]|uniref:uncharacterized protein LOC143281549 n=1 Tax=Babylonia areolata TaxID=304850 RepID=UPI003FCF3D85